MMLGMLFCVTYILTELTLLWLLPGASFVRVLVSGFVFNTIAWFPAFATYCAIRGREEEEKRNDDQ